MRTCTCPNCSASLEIDDSNRDFAFCQYCGAKIMLDDYRSTQRIVDEAAIKRAEVEHDIRLKELALEEKQMGWKKYAIIAWIGATLFCFLLGGIGSLADIEGLQMMYLIGMNVGLWGGLFLMTNKNKDKRRSGSTSGGIKITSALSDYDEKNYEAYISQLRRAGFSDIKAIALQDLNWLSQKKNGKIESVTIDGEDEIEEGDIFSRDASITVTYHSLSK